MNNTLVTLYQNGNKNIRGHLGMCVHKKCNRWNFMVTAANEPLVDSEPNLQNKNKL